jgi:hypothetical protein
MKLVLSLSLILFFSQTRTFSPAGGGGGASEVAAAAAAKDVANAPNARSAAPLVLFASDATTGASGAESSPASTSVDRKAPTTISSMSKGDSREGADAAGPVTEKSPPEDAPGRGAEASAAGESAAKPTKPVRPKASGNQDRAEAESRTAETNRANGANARPEQGESIDSIRFDSIQLNLESIVALRRLDSPTFRTSASIIVGASRGERHVFDVEPPASPGGSSSQPDHPEPALLYDPNTFQGWSESMRGAVLDHLTHPRVLKHYDDLLKIVDESGTQAGLWTKIHRWTPHPCTSAAKRASFECRPWFVVNTMAISKSCNVSTSVLMETIAEGRHPHDQAKQQRLIQQCLEAIRSRTPPVLKSHENPGNATTAATASLWPRLLWFDGATSWSLWSRARGTFGTHSGSIWTRVPWFVVTMFSIPPIWTILKGLTTRIEWLQARTKVACTTLGCVLITSPIADTVVAFTVGVAEVLITNGLTSLGFDDYAASIHTFMNRGRSLLPSPSVLAFQFSAIVAGLQFAFSEVELLRENKRVIIDAIVATSAFSAFMVGCTAYRLSTGTFAISTISFALCVTLEQCFEFWTFPCCFQYDVGSGTHLFVMGRCFILMTVFTTILGCYVPETTLTHIGVSLGRLVDILAGSASILLCSRAFQEPVPQSRAPSPTSARASNAPIDDFSWFRGV